MREKLLSLALAIGLLVPAPALSATAAGRLTVADTIAGLETQATLSGFTPGMSLEVHVLSPDGQDVALPAHTNASGKAAVTVPGELMEHAGTYGAFVSANRMKISQDIAFQVLPGRMDAHASHMETDTIQLAADGVSEAVVTVTVRDAAGNPLADRPVELIGSRLEDRILPLEKDTDRSGRQRFTVRTRAAGQIMLRAMDLLSGITIEQSLSIAAVNAGGAVGGHTDSRLTSDLSAMLDSSNNFLAQASSATVERFEIRLQPEQPIQNEAVKTLEIRALDANDRVVPFIGTIEIIDPDNVPGDTLGNTVLPGLEDDHGVVTSTPSDRGIARRSYAVVFKRSGPRRLIVQDASNETIRGELEVTVIPKEIDPAEKEKITILSHQPGAAIASSKILLEGIACKLSNLEVLEKRNGEESAIATGESGADGSFSIDVDLDPAFGSYELRVQDETGRCDSGFFTLTRDASKPEIEFAFDPERPAEESDVTVTVTGEAGLTDVIMRLEEREISLTEEGGERGTYRAIFRAPKAGDYQPAFIATDAAGNGTEVRGTLNVVNRQLPRVLNVRATPVQAGVELLWDPITTETVGSYVVEVGTTPDAFEHSLDTKEPVTGQIVKGLKPGQTYYFAVKAQHEDRQSERSETVSAVPLGVSLNVQPQEDALLLTWTFPEETALSFFLLEYGTEPDKLTEKRFLPGDLRTYALRDLIGGVPYYLRTTPMDVPGNLLQDLTVTGEGTPLAASEFHPAGKDPVPFRPGQLPPGENLHEGAPNLSVEGLPRQAIWIVIGMSIVGFVWYFRRKRRMTALATERFLQDMQQRYHQ